LNAIASHISPEDVLLDVDVADKAALFELIGRHLQDEAGVPQHVIVHCLARREQAMSTAVGEGLAIPHARIEGLARIHVLYARLRVPIPFRAPDAKPVSDILALLVPSPGTDEHLRLLADATQMFSDPQFRAQLRTSIDPREVFRLLCAWSETAPADQEESGDPSLSTSVPPADAVS